MAEIKQRGNDRGGMEATRDVDFARRTPPPERHGE
jgi:hypothetical protein